MAEMAEASICRLDVIDDACRYLISSVEWESSSSRVVLEALRASVTRYGQPLQVLTINGSVFVPVIQRQRGQCAPDRSGASRIECSMCVREGTTHAIGKVERLHCTIDEESGRMGLELDEHMEYYNHTRPHASLGDRTVLLHSCT
ncbi:MAG: hypothetical protein HXY34_09910 [Candidatus Thorarchaeota archaeon]|nr:hypothetical protein [Candidatus Thorarchaeota archaeon]